MSKYYCFNNDEEIIIYALRSVYINLFIAVHGEEPYFDEKNVSKYWLLNQIDHLEYYLEK